ncbi:hypothetical protein ENBRE01_1787 [Enteropsectra breve]|nr:hypothetical protein ENBRE01_1787 [Enteropsectra breve]
MYCLLIVTNEHKEIILKVENFKNQSSLPVLLAYVSLDGEIEETCEGFKSLCHRCLPGHRLILVHDNPKYNPKSLLKKIEDLLYNELLSPFADDTVYLSSSFENNIKKEMEKCC